MAAEKDLTMPVNASGRGVFHPLASSCARVTRAAAVPVIV